MRQFIALATVVVSLTCAGSSARAASGYEGIPLYRLASGDFSNELGYLPRFRTAWLYSTVPAPRVLTNPLCPRVEEFEGRVLCQAEFEYRGVWYFVAGHVTKAESENNIFEEGSTVPVSGGDPNETATIDFARTWHRWWRTEPASCLRGWNLRGTIRTNDGDCDGQLAGDLVYNGQVSYRASKVQVHGTDLAGFGPIVVYHCHPSRPHIRCANAVGDSFSYTP
jgi:hypothetical protein